MPGPCTADREYDEEEGEPLGISAEAMARDVAMQRDEAIEKRIQSIKALLNAEEDRLHTHRLATGRLTGRSAAARTRFLSSLQSQTAAQGTAAVADEEVRNALPPAAKGAAVNTIHGNFHRMGPVRMKSFDEFHRRWTREVARCMEKRGIIQ